MKVNYCDLCQQPLKGNDYIHIYSAPAAEEVPYDSLSEYYTYLNKMEKQVKDICPTCKTIIDKIFELRLQNLSLLANELLGIYKLPSLPNPKDRRKNKNGK